MNQPQSKMHSKIYSIDESEMNNQVVQAVAGAGKTTTLIKKVISIGINHYQKTGEFPKIVMTTFTVKATQELKERLLNSALYIKNNISEFNFNHTPQLPDNLINWINKGNSVFITTIHGLIIKYLQQYGTHAIGLFSDFSVTDDFFSEQKTWLKQKYFENSDLKILIEDLLIEESFDKLTQLLVQYFHLKLSYPNLGPYDTQADANILKQVLNDLSGSLKSFISLASQAKLNTPKRQNAFAFLSQLSEQIQWQLGNNDFFAVTQHISEQLSLNKSILSGLSFSEDHIKSQYKQIQKSFELATSDCFLKPFLDQIKIKNSKYSQFFDTLFLDWLKFKTSSNILELSDIEPFGAYAIRQSPETSTNFSQTWDYWLIDEYQDTSPLQAQILQDLRKLKPCFIVGDPQQSIYLFRGSRPVVFEQAHLTLTPPPLSPKKLNCNYRSEPEIIDFINSALETRINQYVTMIPQVQTQSDQIKVLGFEYFWEDNTSSAEGANLLFKDQLYQAIKHNLDQGFIFKDIHILARTHNQISKVSEALTQLNVPHQINASGHFFINSEIRQALILLRFILFPDDNINFTLLMRLPFFKLDDSFIITFLSQQKTKPLWQSLKLLGSLNPIQTDFVKLLNDTLLSASQGGIFRAWRVFLYQSQLFYYWIQNDKTNQAESNLWKLLDLAFSAIQNQSKSWNQFYWESLNHHHEGDNITAGVSALESNRIQIMTIHASKGLEFLSVIFPLFYERNKNSSNESLMHSETQSWWTLPIKYWPTADTISLWPYQAQLLKDSISELEKEELDRVMYVALTRAKKALTLLLPTKVHKEGSIVSDIKNLLIQKGRLRPCQSNETALETALENATSAEADTMTSPVLSTPALSTLKKNQTEFMPLNFAKSKNTTAELSFTKSSKLNYAFSNKTDFNRFIKRIEGIKTHKDLQKSLVTNQFEWVFQEEPEFNVLWERGHKEWGFSYLTSDKTRVTGQIDLWGYLNNQTMVIVDYKTGSSQHAEKGWAQLMSYYEALKKGKKISKALQVELWLIFINEKKIFKKPGGVLPPNDQIIKTS